MLYKKEHEYLEYSRKFPEVFKRHHPDSVKEGFKYFMSLKKVKQHIRFNFFNTLKKTRVLYKYYKEMINLWKDSFLDLQPYYDELTQTGSIQPLGKYDATYPNSALWFELQEFIARKWDDVILGFTEVPSQLIFKNKAILFTHCLIVGQEMKKDKNDKAPGVQHELRVYTSLGLVINEIARWLREKGIKCQSNTAYAGLVCTPPLAGKAGLGWQGRHGLLITPQFGARIRLAPVYLQEKIFEYTDNNDHIWIEAYCEKCGLCQKNCPEGAINSEKIINIADIPGIGALKKCIDMEKCYKYHTSKFPDTTGCTICLNSCPFSTPGFYTKLKPKTKTSSFGNNSKYHSFE